MKTAGLRAKAARKFKATTNSNYSLPVTDNLLKQNFTANHANEKWVSDITYIWTSEGWLYSACSAQYPCLGFITSNIPASQCLTLLKKHQNAQA